MDYSQFEAWFQKLGKADRDYLEGRPGWEKEHRKIRASRSLPEGFAERTMEILESGSESET